jgi:hypothetical protein
VRVAVLALLLVGCASAPSGPLIVSWRFADGRDCDTAGANFVETRTTRALDTAALTHDACTDGLAPATTTLAMVPGAGTLYVDALTFAGGDLYHAELALDREPPGTGETRAITLYAVAAQ